MTIESLTERLVAFSKERDWQQFHTPKDLAISISVEAAELLEHFQWKTNEEIQAALGSHQEQIGEEMADVLNYLVFLAHELGIDLLAVADKKITKNALRYPVETIRGHHTNKHV